MCNHVNIWSVYRCLRSPIPGLAPDVDIQRSHILFRVVGLLPVDGLGWPLPAGSGLDAASSALSHPAYKERRSAIGHTPWRSHVLMKPVGGGACGSSCWGQQGDTAAILLVGNKGSESIAPRHAVISSCKRELPLCFYWINLWTYFTIGVVPLFLMFTCSGRSCWGNTGNRYMSIWALIWSHRLSLILVMGVIAIW